MITGANSTGGGISTATCPSGKVLLGGGAEFVSGGGNLLYSKPQAAGVAGSWIAQGSAGSSVVRAYAVCTV